MAFVSSLFAQQVIISGRIMNPNSDYFQLVGTDQNILDSVVLDEENSVRITADVQEGLYYLTDGEEYAEIYLTPGDELNFELNAKEFDESLKFSGQGSKINNFMMKRFLVDEDRNETFGHWELMKLEEERLLQVLDSLENADILILSEYLSPSDATYAKNAKRIHYGKINKLAAYPASHAYVRGIKDFKVSDNFPDAFEGLNLNDIDAVDVDEYTEVLSSYVNRELFKDREYADSVGYLIGRLETINKLFEAGAVKEMILQNMADYLYRTAEPRSRAYALYMQMSSDEDFKQKIREMEEGLQKIDPGMESPELVLNDIHGKQFTLSEQKGKLVYIDVWATWCGPCLAELPFLEKVQEEFKDKDVVFVSVAWQDNKENWEKMVKSKEMGGVQLFATNPEAEFFTTYKINAVPTFILLDRDGIIVDSDAKRPSDEKLKTQLYELLGMDE